jgi:hypothetical protein
LYRPRFWSYAAGLARIHIDIPSRTLAFYYSGRSYGPYPLGLGKPSTPTPQGDWGVAEKDPDPWWEVLGSRWMGLDIPWGTYGIHGTNMDWSIGGYVSNGCIRMHNWDVEAIYPLVVIGTPVVISGAYPAQYQGEYWWQAVQRKKEERRANRRSAGRMMSAK